jgi:hypothetical protein
MEIAAERGAPRPRELPRDAVLAGGYYTARDWASTGELKFRCAQNSH